jgi:hypothetical protein
MNTYFHLYPPMGPCIECHQQTDIRRKDYPVMGGNAFYCTPCQEKNGRVLPSNAGSALTPQTRRCPHCEAGDPFFDASRNSHVVRAEAGIATQRCLGFDGRDAREAVLTNFVFEFLGAAKASQWWNAPNPMLGNITPNDMIRLGKRTRLFDWLEQQMAANFGLAESRT